MQLCGKILLYEENSHLYLRDRFSSAVKEKDKKNYADIQLFTAVT